MLRAAHEGWEQQWWHARHPLPPSRPTTNSFVLAVESKVPPRKCSRFLELIGSVVVAVPPTTQDIYEPIVCYLGWREELSSAGSAIAGRPGSMPASLGCGSRTRESRAWLEAECLAIARRTLGGSEIQRVTIRRLRPKGTGPNWKVADIIPQPTLEVGGEVRKTLARLPGRYALEDES